LHYIICNNVAKNDNFVTDSLLKPINPISFMATATAPEKTVAKTAKRQEPAFYIFRLTEKFPELFKGSSPYPARLDLPVSDTILWPYLDDRPVGFDENFDPKDVYYSPRAIRYVAGSSSIFVDEQEKNSEAYKLDNNGRNRLLDNEANKRDLTFQNAEIRVPSHNRVLRNYLWCNNQCKNQFAKANDRGNKYKMLNAKYEMLDFGGKDQVTITLGQSRAKAYELAKTARTEQLLPHAKFLGISFIHYDTNEPKDMEAIKEEYIDYAYKNPEAFMKSFTDPKVKIMYQIRNLVEQGDITIGGKTAGQAHWVSTGGLITQLPADRDAVEFLAEFAITKDGEEFSNNLRAYSNEKK
jgi:hypothetical protein